MSFNTGKLPLNKDVRVSIMFSLLPANAVISGKALKSAGTDMRGESNGSTTTLSFDGETVAAVRDELAKVAFDSIEISSIRFPGS